MSRNEQVLNHLTMRGSITALQAMQEYGIFRLAARIKDLRNKGYHIDTGVATTSRSRYASYRMRAAL